MFGFVPNTKTHEKVDLLMQHQNNNFSFTVFYILYCFPWESIELHESTSYSEGVFRSI